MPSGVYERDPKKTRTKITPEMRERFLAMRAEGKNSRQIGEEFKLHPTTVGKFLRREKQTKPTISTKTGNAQGPTKGDGKYGHLVPEMQALVAQGLTHRQIAEKLGMAVSTVSYYLTARNKRKATQSLTLGVSTNGHEQLDTRFLVGFGCAELERTLTTIAQRLGITPNLLRQGFSKFLGSSPVRS